MTRTLSALALAMAISLVGCNSTNGTKTTDNQPNTLNNNPVYAQDPKLTDAKTDMVNQLEQQDRYFVNHAGAAGAYEIQASQIALNRSSSDNVKMVAHHMIDDHTKAADKLTAIARDKGMNVAALPTDDQQKMLDKLNTLGGAEFDKEYLSQQEKAHQDTLVVFQQENRLGKDNDLKNFAGNMIPTLGDHLKMVQDAMRPTVGMNQ